MLMGSSSLWWEKVRGHIPRQDLTACAKGTRPIHMHIEANKMGGGGGGMVTTHAHPSHSREQGEQQHRAKLNPQHPSITRVFRPQL
jgi:hypothetical protein